MGQNREPLDKLDGKPKADPQGPGGFEGEEPVVKAAAVTEPMALPVKGRPGQDDQVDGRGIERGLLDQVAAGFGYTQVARLQVAVRIGDAHHAQAGNGRQGQRRANGFSGPQTGAQQWPGGHLAAEAAVQAAGGAGSEHRVGGQRPGYPLAAADPFRRGKIVPAGQGLTPPPLPVSRLW